MITITILPDTSMQITQATKIGVPDTVVFSCSQEVYFMEEWFRSPFLSLNSWIRNPSNICYSWGYQTCSLFEKDFQFPCIIWYSRQRIYLRGQCSCYPICIQPIASIHYEISWNRHLLDSWLNSTKRNFYYRRCQSISRHWHKIESRPYFSFVEITLNALFGFGRFVLWF